MPETQEFDVPPRRHDADGTNRPARRRRSAPGSPCDALGAGPRRSHVPTGRRSGGPRLYRAGDRYVRRRRDDAHPGGARPALHAAAETPRPHARKSARRFRGCARVARCRRRSGVGDRVLLRWSVCSRTCAQWRTRTFGGEFPRRAHDGATRPTRRRQRPDPLHHRRQGSVRTCGRRRLAPTGNDCRRGGLAGHDVRRRFPRLHVSGHRRAEHPWSGLRPAAGSAVLGAGLWSSSPRRSSADTTGPLRLLDSLAPRRQPCCAIVSVRRVFSPRRWAEMPIALQHPDPPGDTTQARDAHRQRNCALPTLAHDLLVESAHRVGDRRIVRLEETFTPVELLAHLPRGHPRAVALRGIDNEDDTDHHDRQRERHEDDDDSLLRQSTVPEPSLRRSRVGLAIGFLTSHSPILSAWPLTRLRGMSTRSASGVSDHPLGTWTPSSPAVDRRRHMPKGSTSPARARAFLFAARQVHCLRYLAS